jgi:ribosomal protein S18 acetylase RimI-like enzyme
VIPRALKELAREAHGIIASDGLASYVRRSPVLLLRLLYWRQERYIWRKDLDAMNGSFTPDADCDWEVVSTPEELDKLLRKGFSIGPPFDIQNPRRMLAQHQVGFLIFKQRKLAWWGWGVTEPGIDIFPPLEKLDFTKEAYFWRAFTLSQYRGLGLHSYGTFKRLEYFKEKGKSSIVLTTLKDNEPAIRTERILGLAICGEMNLRRLLLWESWTEKWYDGR